MPIQLASPLDVGAMDANSPYQEFKVTKFIIDIRQNMVTVGGTFGNTVDGAWVPSVPSPTTHLTEYVDGAQYETIMETMPKAGEKIYDAAGRVLYEHLQSVDPRLAGTIV
jgi:hypothetical protein